MFTCTLWDLITAAFKHYNYDLENFPLRDFLASRVEAENIQTVWAVIQKWFERLEDGTASSYYPDPTQPVSADEAECIITELDKEFEHEAYRTPELLRPEFSRLAPHARLAFAQEIKQTLKTTSQLQKELTRRYAWFLDWYEHHRHEPLKAAGKDLSYCDLRAIPAKDAILDRANLSNCRLPRMMAGARVREANLQGTFGATVNAQNADFMGADFSGAQGLYLIAYGADLRYTRWTNAAHVVIITDYFPLSTIEISKDSDIVVKCDHHLKGIDYVPSL